MRGLAQLWTVGLEFQRELGGSQGIRLIGREKTCHATRRRSRMARCRGSRLLRLDRFCRRLRCQNLSFPLKIAKEGGQRHSERRRHLGDVLETEVALAALDGSHERPVHPTLVSELFL